MNFATIFAVALLVGPTATTASSLRRNRIYDVTGEFGRFDESEPSFESLFRELAQDDLKMGFQNSMSHDMSMGITPTPTSGTSTSAPSAASPSPSMNGPPTTPAPSPSSSPAPNVPTSPTPSPTPTNTVPGSPTTDAPTTGANGGCTTLDPAAFQNDASAEVFLKIDVDTVSDSTGFLNDLMDAILAALQNEFGLCLPGSSRRTLMANTIMSSRRLEDGTTESITGVTLGNTELPSGQSCESSSDGNTCHVVFSSVVVYGSSQLVATEGAGRVVAALEKQDFAEGDIVDVRVAERDDGDTISNGVSNSDNELGVETTVSSSSTTASSVGPAIALSLIGAALIAMVIIFLSRPRHDAENDMASSNEKEFEIEEVKAQQSLRRMNTVEV